jgi:hypothetical protein
MFLSRPSINALVYRPQRTASSRLKVYTNLKLQAVTHRFEYSIKLHKGSDNFQPTRATREASTPQDLNLQAENLLTLEGSFWAY